MKNQPFIIPLLGLMFGIVSFEIIPEFTGLILGFLFIFNLIIFFARLKSPSFSILVFSSFLVLGMGLIKIKEIRLQTIPIHTKQKNYVHLKIKEDSKPLDKFYKYKAEIISVDSISNLHSNALLYWKKEFSNLNIGDEIWLHSRISVTPKPLNPYQFDYADYLKRQGILYTIFADSVNFKSKSGHSLSTKIEEFKRKIYVNLIENGYSKNSADLIAAMILGKRNEIDQNLIDNYRKTGVVHILSISGLHVMMVYSVFFFLFYPLILIPKGKLIQMICCLVFIWLYAVFVGLRPSVSRAALMISIFQLTLHFSRKANIYHSLTLSAFLLLLWNPYNLFDIGFQLSFSAVFFIVWFLPVFMKLFKPQNIFSKILVGFMATSIAAQIGTFPISAYYFHQASLLFLAGNIVMMIAAYFMIIVGIIVVIVTSLNFFPTFLIKTYNEIISICNAYIDWLSSHESLIFDRISIRLPEVILLILAMVFFRNFLLKFKFRPLLMGLVLILFFESHRIWTRQNLNHKKEFIVFHQTRNSVIGIRNGENLDVWISNAKDSENIKKYLLNPYEIHEGIRFSKIYAMSDSIHSDYFKSGNLIWWNGKKFLFVKENTEIPLKLDYLLIQNNAKINLDSVPNSTRIILDGSNYPNFLKDNNLNIWRTRAKGAFRITE